MARKVTKIVCEIITSHEFDDAGIAEIESELRNQYGGNLNIDSVSVTAETLEFNRYYCENCNHSGEETEFVPSDGSEVPLICPKCSSVDVFVKECPYCGGDCADIDIDDACEGYQSDMDGLLEDDEEWNAKE